MESVGGVLSARGQDSSVGGVAVVIYLGVVEGVQVRVQVEVGREEQSERRDTRRERQSEETTRNKRSTAHHGWHDACMQTLEPCDVIHIIRRANVHEKNDV